MFVKHIPTQCCRFHIKTAWSNYINLVQVSNRKWRRSFSNAELLRRAAAWIAKNEFMRYYRTCCVIWSEVTVYVWRFFTLLISQQRFETLRSFNLYWVRSTQHLYLYLLIILEPSLSCCQQEKSIILRGFSFRNVRYFEAGFFFFNLKIRWRTAIWSTLYNLMRLNSTIQVFCRQVSKCCTLLISNIKCLGGIKFRRQI